MANNKSKPGSKVKSVEILMDQQSPVAVLRQLNMLLNSTSIIRRSELYSQLGKDTYDGDRNIYEALGYPTSLSTEDYLNRYNRGDISTRLNDLMPNECWNGGITISDEGDPEKDSDFEREWKKIEKDLDIWAVMKRADQLCGLGRYSILFLGFGDAETDEQLKEEVTVGSNLVYVQPYGENTVTIQEWEQNPGNARYGQPLIYKISSTGESRDENINVLVHHTRVVHIAENLLDSKVYGKPRLENIYNILIDLDRIRGGSGEMFWRGARPGYVAKLDPDAKAGDQTINDIKEELDEFEHNLRRYLRLTGISLEPITPQVVDPRPHWETQMKSICVAKGIPMRILLGSERGELASSQDERAWKEKIEERRSNFVEPIIIRTFVDRLIKYQTLPDPIEKQYTVEFKNLWSLDKKAQAEIAKNLSTAIKEYSTNPQAEEIVPIQLYLTEVLGWSEEKAKDAADMIVESFIAEEG